MKKNEKIYGIHSVTEFIKVSPDRIINLWIQESIESESILSICDMAKSNGLLIQKSKKETLDKMVNMQNHQGVVLQIMKSSNASTNSIEEILEKNKDKNPIYLILDSIQDPHNLGACIRTALASGVSAVIIPKDRAARINETVRKVACGAVENINIITVVNLVQTIKKLKEKGAWIIGTDGDAEQSIYDFDLKSPIAIVVGGENKGIRTQVLKECDFVGSLPTTEDIESLNVSVTTGIVLFEAVRQRKYK